MNEGRPATACSMGKEATAIAQATKGSTSSHLSRRWKWKWKDRAKLSVKTIWLLSTISRCTVAVDLVRGHGICTHQLTSVAERPLFLKLPSMSVPLLEGLTMLRSALM